MGVRWLDEPCAQDRNQERQRQDAEQENGQTVETARERREVGKEVVPVKDQRPHPAKLTRHILHGERDELLQTERGKVIDGNGHLFVGEEVDEIVAERERKVTERLTRAEDGIAVAQGGQRARAEEQDKPEPVAVIDLAETAERETVFPFHGITSRLPEAENEIAHEEHAEQDEQNFPDVFQCFHVFGILVNDFLLCCGCFFGFSIDFFGSLCYDNNGNGSPVSSDR